LLIAGRRIDPITFQAAVSSIIQGGLRFYICQSRLVEKIRRKRPVLLDEGLYESQGADSDFITGAIRHPHRDILCHDDFGCLAVPYELATEDGSLGEEGLVTRLLARELEAAGDGVSVFACGPSPMLAAVARACAREDTPCWVSMEAYMACGVGACLGCVIPGRSGGYLRVCKEGPVFRSEAVDWDALLGKPD
jgi:dihydroorotate dehydrogenase electron transfer subunit